MLCIMARKEDLRKELSKIKLAQALFFLCGLVYCLHVRVPQTGSYFPAILTAAAAITP